MDAHNDPTEENQRLASPICFYCHASVVEDVAAGGWHHAIYLHGKKHVDDRGHAPVRYVLAMLGLMAYHWTLAFPVVRAWVDFLEAL